MSTTIIDADDVVYEMSLAAKVAYTLMRFTAALSLLSSWTIALELRADYRHNRKTIGTASRVLLALQFCLALMDLGWIMGTTAAPEGLTWGARGGIASCTVQGFLVQMGAYGATLWDMALSLTYVLMVKYNWTADALKRFEWAAHGLIWAAALAAAVVPLFFESYNLYHGFCFVISWPHNCQDIDGLSCIRCGAWTEALVTAFSALVLLAMVWSVACMVTIYKYAKTLEVRNARYDIAASGDFQTNKNSSYTTSTTTSSQSFNAGTTTTPKSSTTTHHAPHSSYSQRIAWEGFRYSATLITVGSPAIIGALLYSLDRNYHYDPNNNNNNHTDRSGLSAFSMVLLSLHGFCYLGMFQTKRREMRTRPGRAFRRCFVALGRSVAIVAGVFQWLGNAIRRSNDDAMPNGDMPMNKDSPNAPSTTTASSTLSNNSNNNNIAPRRPPVTSLTALDEGPEDFHDDDGVSKEDEDY